jgi:4'-phosphopantetheinyl transferase
MTQQWVADDWRWLRQRLRRRLDDGHAFAVVLLGCSPAPGTPVLSDEELARAARFLNANDAANFIMGRTLLRRLLLEDGTRPAPPVTHGPFGKPSIEGLAHFNLAHAADHVAMIVSAAGPVGIDVEAGPRALILAGLLPSIGHPSELSFIARAEREARPQLARRLWVRKEAVLKAAGTGLIDAMHEVNTRLALPHPVVLHGRAVRLLDLLEDDKRCLSAAVPPQVKGVEVIVAHDTVV